MSWALITVEGTLEVIPGDPTQHALFTRLGDPELVDTEHATWVVTGEHAIAAGLPPNQVGGAMALLLSAPWRQYAGPLAFIGRIGATRDALAGPLDAPSLNALILMHSHVSAVLDLPPGSASPVPDLVPADEIRKAAEFMRLGEMPV